VTVKLRASLRGSGALAPHLLGARAASPFDPPSLPANLAVPAAPRALPETPGVVLLPRWRLSAVRRAKKGWAMLPMSLAVGLEAAPVVSHPDADPEPAREPAVEVDELGARIGEQRAGRGEREGHLEPAAEGLDQAPAREGLGKGAQVPDQPGAARRAYQPREARRAGPGGGLRAGEGGHARVPDLLEHNPAGAAHLVPDQGEHSRDHAPRLGVAERLVERGRAGHVGEEHRHARAARDAKRRAAHAGAAPVRGGFDIHTFMTACRLYLERMSTACRFWKSDIRANSIWSIFGSY